MSEKEWKSKVDYAKNYRTYSRRKYPQAKLIRTEGQYQEVLNYLETLEGGISHEEAENLDLIVLCVEAYESKLQNTTPKRKVYTVRFEDMYGKIVDYHFESYSKSEKYVVDSMFYRNPIKYIGEQEIVYE